MDAGGPGRLLLLARSSLQLVLASALAEEALQTRAQRSWLIFLPDMADRHSFEHSIASWQDTPFERIVTIEPRSIAGGRRNRPWRKLQQELIEVLDAARPSGVAVFNDREEAGQILLIAAATRFPAARRECVEDGSQAYTGHTYRAVGRLTRWRQQLRLGAPWRDVRVLGTHELVQCVVATQPDLLRPELRKRPLRALPGGYLSSQSLRSLALSFAAHCRFDAAGLPAHALLLTLSHSSYAQRNPDYLKLVSATVAACQTRGLALHFKYHPREVHPDPLGLCASGATEVPRSLPAECLYLLVRDRPLLVVAGMSTALLTAALMMPRARFVALSHASANGDAWSLELRSALHITALGDEAAIDSYLADSA